MLLKDDCLPNAGEKQPSISLIYLGRKWTLKLMMMMMMMMYVVYVCSLVFDMIF